MMLLPIFGSAFMHPICATEIVIAGKMPLCFVFAFAWFAHALPKMLPKNAWEGAFPQLCKLLGRFWPWKRRLYRQLLALVFYLRVRCACHAGSCGGWHAQLGQKSDWLNVNNLLILNESEKSAFLFLQFRFLQFGICLAIRDDFI